MIQCLAPHLKNAHIRELKVVFYIDPALYKHFRIDSSLYNNSSI